MRLMVNRRQAVVLTLGLLAIVMLGLFPPWLGTVEELVLRDAGSRDASWKTTSGYIGCHFVLLGPGEHLVVRKSRLYELERIDAARLLIHWVAVAAITAALVTALRDRKRATRTLPGGDRR
jgi:hypothetical protein